MIGKHKGDAGILIASFGLAIFGIAMISSASAIIAYQNELSNSYYFWRQLMAFGLGIFAFYIAQKIPYFYWKQFAVPLLFISLIGLVFVFIPGIGADWGTSQSWISVPLLGSIQPVEIAKFGLICYLASWMSARQKDLKYFGPGFLPFLVIVGSILALLAMQPDFGSILVIAFIAGSMYFVWGGHMGYLFWWAGIATIIGYFVIRSREYIYNRFVAFLDGSIDPMGVGYHIKQALIAVGSGGFWGRGFGNSRQKFEYLPEAQSDSIFAIISEELGFFRSFLIVAAFFYLFHKGMQVAQNAPDRFGFLLAFGISLWILIQAFINIMVNLSLAPITGITLPLVSHGGSSLIMVMFALGILYNISKYQKQNYQNVPLSKRKTYL